MARSNVRREVAIPYFLRPRSRQALHSQVGQALQTLAPGRDPQENPIPRCLAGEAIESEAPGRDPQENPLLRPGQPGSIISPCSSQLVGSPKNKPFQHVQLDGPSYCQLSYHLPCSNSLSPKTSKNNHLIKSKDLLFVAAFNVRTLCQIGQQASLAQTLLSLNIDVCCVSETRIQDPTSILRLVPPRSNHRFSHFTLRVSGDSAASARGVYGVGIALSPRAEQALLDWIPISSRLCAVRLGLSMKVNADRKRNRCLFVVSAYAPKDCSSEEDKDNFYRDLSNLLNTAKSSDIVFLAGDMNAQIGRLNDTESHLGGRFAVDAPRTDNGERLLQLCADHDLFLANTNFQHKRLHRLTWRPPNDRCPWKQLDHIAISRRWRASIQDCRSFWSTPLDSDHALVRACVSFKFPSGRRKASQSINFQQLQSPSTSEQYQMALAQNLRQLNNIHDIDQEWNYLKSSMQNAINTVCPRSSLRMNERWISSRSTNLIESRKTIPADASNDKNRKLLRRRIAKSLRRDRERWWMGKAQAMQKAFASGNSRTLFQLIRSTGPRKLNVSEVIKEKDGTVITSQERRLERWAEHFAEQFAWPPSSAHLQLEMEPTWDVDLHPPSIDEVLSEISRLNANKAPGPDELHPLLLKKAAKSLSAI